MKLSRTSTRRRRGRPLSFDRQAALEKAMLAFWQSGYETTSVADLTAAMEISVPSLYTAFGDKRQLFLEAVRLYAGDLEDVTGTIDAAPSALDAARALLTAAAHTFTGERTPPGCLLASATATGSSASDDVRKIIAERRVAVEHHLRARVLRDVQEGRLPERADAAALAGLVMAVVQGFSVLARDGADRRHLLEIVEAALAAWPTAEKNASPDGEKHVEENM